MDIVQWLNSNSGFVMAVLTFVYVAATAIIVVANTLVVREMRKTREQQLKPNIVASFEIRRKGLMCFVIRNHGGSTANELKVDVSEEFIKKLGDSEQAKFRGLRSASLTIVPNQEVIHTAGGSKDFAKLAESHLVGAVSYKDPSGKTRVQKFDIWIESFKNALLYGPVLDELTATLDQRLREIAHQMGGDAG
jgi:hypothetical protein